MTLQITWFGHAAFLVEGDGRRVLLDPYKTPDVGSYDAIETEADIVLVSHINEKYHSHWDAATNHPVRLNGLDFADAPDGVEASGVHFRAVKVFESPTHETPVSMPFFTLAGVSVCHSGDLGHSLSLDKLAPIRGVDVFLAVAGGPPTVALPDLKAIIDALAPRVVVPMHYQNGKVNLNLRPVDDFLALFSPAQIVRHDSPTLTLSPETLPPATTVFVLPSAR